jgi:hypothetical protein
MCKTNQASFRRSGAAGGWRILEVSLSDSKKKLSQTGFCHCEWGEHFPLCCWKHLTLSCYVCCCNIQNSISTYLPILDQGLQKMSFDTPVQSCKLSSVQRMDHRMIDRSYFCHLFSRRGMWENGGRMSKTELLLMLCEPTSSLIWSTIHLALDRAMIHLALQDFVNICMCNHLKTRPASFSAVLVSQFRQTCAGQSTQRQHILWNLQY